VRAPVPGAASRPGTSSRELRLLFRRGACLLWRQRLCARGSAGMCCAPYGEDSACSNGAPLRSSVDSGRPARRARDGSSPARAA